MREQSVEFWMKKEKVPEVLPAPLHPDRLHLRRWEDGVRAGLAMEPVMKTLSIEGGGV